MEALAGMIPNLKVEVIDPVLCKGMPSESDFNALDELAAAIAEKHSGHVPAKELGQPVQLPREENKL